MIARCPECQARYRLAREKIGAGGARIRCAKCRTVFKVAAPDAADTSATPPQPSPAARAEAQKPPPPPPKPEPTPEPVARALIAEPDPDVAKQMVAFLERWRIAADVVDNGGVALLRLFRRQPDLAILGGHLPALPGPILAEIICRSADLQEIPLIRIAPMDEPPGTPEFDAGELLEPGDLPQGLGQALESLGVGEKPAAAKLPAPARPVAPEPTAAPAAASPPAAPASAAAAPAPKRRARPPLSDNPEIAAAERLARISVSDIILYNEEKFQKGVSDGNVVAALESELAEARHMFEQRVSAELRAQRDFLAEELQRRASAQG